MCSKLLAGPSKRPHPSAKENAHSEAKRSVAMADKRSTLGLYALKTKDSPYGIPFVALTDDLALTAAMHLLPLADVYKVGSFCRKDGKCSACSRPRLVRILDNKVS